MEVTNYEKLQQKNRSNPGIIANGFKHGDRCVSGFFGSLHIRIL